MSPDPDFERARSRFAEGTAHFEAGRYAEAEASLRASLALLPGRASTLSNLGATLMKLERYGDALAVLDDALAASPDEIEALGHRAHALNVLGRHEDALTTLERFLALCGDRAAGWFHHGQTLQLLGRHEEAVGSYERTIALMPDHAQAWSNRGGALKDLGRGAEAAASFERALALGADAELNRYYLASVRGGGDTPPTSPRAFVRNLFDSYAAGFDTHLVHSLHYRAPERLAQLAAQARADSAAQYRSALDLGCGTGLCGAVLRPLALRLHGVDLSPPMLAAARDSGRYDELFCDDVVDHLRQTAYRHDLVVAADVFIYIGELQPVFDGVRRVLEPGGCFAFSVERGDDAVDYALLPSMRYAHSESYLARLAEAHGLRVRQLERGPLRRDGDGEIPGSYLLLERVR